MIVKTIFSCGVNRQYGDPPLCNLCIDVVNPPDRLNIVDRDQISLSSYQVRNPKDHLADNFNGNPGSRRISGSVPTQVLG